MIRAKYGCGNDLLPEIEASKQGSNTWNGIKQNWDKTKEEIQRITDSNGGEQVRWRWERSGLFTIKSAYQALYSGTTESDFKWNAIWKLKIPQRCKTFAWLMMHEKLVTNKLKWRWNIHNTVTCDRCNHEIEDVLHALKRL